MTPKNTQLSVGDMTQHIHESNLIEGFDSAEADKCLAEAWDFLSKQTKLTHAKIKTAQRLATNHQTDLKSDWRGQYRKIPVYIGGREGLSYWLIKDHMDAWLYRVMEWSKDPKIEHIEFEKIHPFVDGNGRTGRMLMWWHELKLGKKPTLILNSEKGKYYAWFK